MGRCCRLVALLLLAVVALAAARVLLWRQADDAERVAAKATYLDGLAARAGGRRPGPNVVLVLFDDLGYGDLGVYGRGGAGDAIRTPHLDRLAAEGALFRNAYATSPYCSGSRAGLLTGRYAVRSGLDHVVQAPWTWRDLLLRLGGRNRRLPLEEITIAEALQAAGWETAIVGKWHLGDFSPSLPHERGFDSFFGLLHSNDQGRPALRRNGEVVEAHPIDQETLTRRYTDEALAFLGRPRERPFFLYLPHTFPHVPLHAAADRRGRSPAGLYGDVVEELDDSVGRLAAELSARGLAGDTLLLVTSDNGPWFQGSPGGTRGRKFDVFEGGMRVPLVAWWPGRIAAGRVIDEPVMGIDIFPTLLELAGLPPPTDRVIDGESLAPLLAGTGGLAREALLFFQIDKLRAVRAGRFKYHDRQRLLYGNPMGWPLAPFTPRGPWLFDLAADPDESYDVTERYPAEAARLRALLEAKRREMAEDRRGWW